MTNQWVKIFQHHVNEKEPVSLEVLEAAILMHDKLIEMMNKSLNEQALMISSLQERIKSLESWREGANKLSE